MNSEAFSIPPANTLPLLPGDPSRLGSHCDDEGVFFSVFSEHAQSLTLCLFDESGDPLGQNEFTACDNGVWHGYVPAARAGMQYGYRAHGQHAPAEGLFFNPDTLLLDPYARGIAQAGSNQRGRAIVLGDLPARRAQVRVPAHDRLIYEAHVRGFTAQLAEIPEALRGSYLGIAEPAVVRHLRALGVTSLQLLPVQAFANEPHLSALGLTNYWGYNSLNFFTPHAAYACLGEADGAFQQAEKVRADMRAMVRALHDANIEVILDVVFNHTCEGGADGAISSLRGLDNPTYYRLDDERNFINDTGCGNTLNTNHPMVQRLIVDSLKCWATDYEIDGFRFDLAVTLGRDEQGFNPEHPLLVQLQREPALRHCSLIAEPWDVGPGGYQTGGFPAPWLEWNDRFRDSVRGYWRNDSGTQAELGQRLHGSSDLFESRGVHASVNLISAHDGFTLADTVAYVDKHNEANGEDNRDGHSHNLSDNLGVEGETNDAGILAARDRRSRAMLATLLLAQGTPMLLAGDELKNSQAGNNNAYCQDNPIGWLQWDKRDRAHVDLIGRLVDLRRRLPAFALQAHIHAALGLDPIEQTERPAARVGWQRADGAQMTDADWRGDGLSEALPFALVWEVASSQIILALNPTASAVPFQLSAAAVDRAAVDRAAVDSAAGRSAVAYRWLFDSADAAGAPATDRCGASMSVAAQSIAVFESQIEPLGTATKLFDSTEFDGEAIAIGKSEPKKTDTNKTDKNNWTDS